MYQDFIHMASYTCCSLYRCGSIPPNPWLVPTEWDTLNFDLFEEPKKRFFRTFGEPMSHGSCMWEIKCHPSSIQAPSIMSLVVEPLASSWAPFLQVALWEAVLTRSCVTTWPRSALSFSPPPSGRLLLCHATFSLAQISLGPGGKESLSTYQSSTQESNTRFPTRQLFSNCSLYLSISILSIYMGELEDKDSREVEREKRSLLIKQEDASGHFFFHFYAGEEEGGCNRDGLYHIEALLGGTVSQPFGLCSW